MRLIMTASLILSVMIAKANGGDEGTKPRYDRINGEDVYGFVTDAVTDKPIKEVTITAILLGKKEKITITGLTGEYGIDDLKPGTYKLVFEKDGFKKVVKEKVTIKANSTVHLDVEMEGQAYELNPSPFRFMEMR